MSTSDGTATGRDTRNGTTMEMTQPRLYECDTDADVFIARCSVAVSDSVDEHALRTAIQRLIDRHEILRTAAGSHLQARLSSDSGNRVLELRLPALVADRRTLHNLVAELNVILNTAAGEHIDSAAYALVERWKHDLLLEAEAQVGVAFWKAKLANPPPPPRLLIEKPESRARPFAPERISLAVAPQTQAAAQALADKLGVSLQAVLLTVWKTLLARFTESAELLLGVMVSGRSDEGLENVIGPLSAVLPLRMPFRRDIALEPAIEETYRNLFDVEAWQECLPAAAAEQLPFVFELVPEEVVTTSSPLRLIDLYVCAQSFLIRLGWRRDSVDLDFDSNRLAAADVRHCGEAFRELLQQICARPQMAGGAVPIITAAERVHFLQHHCVRPAVSQDPQPVHESIVALARSAPDRIAIASRGESISYGQLERWSRRIASDLRSKGVGTEQSVAILAERSPQMIAAVLGVMRAGAAFVPLDRLAPAERHRAVLGDARPKAMMVPSVEARRLWEPLAAEYSLPVVDCGNGHGEACQLPRIHVHPESAAYVLYTSGSTGRPKGITITHRALANHMAWLIEALGIAAQDRILQRTPLSFDASIWELFAPLMSGGCQVLCASDADFDADGLLDTVRECEPTVLQTVPSLLRSLSLAGLAQAKSIRMLCCGGEQLSARLWHDCVSVLGVAPVNLYGPTEACIDTSWWQEGPADGKSVPIGRPIGGAEVFILEGDELASPGMSGEIYIGGAGLARGYVNQPQLTAAAFVPHSWSMQPGARLYRTGDSAFWDGAGVANYVGRRDDQIKLRGVRLQLEEIRAALLQHHAVRDCAVMPPGEDDGRQDLRAFVELHAGQDRGHDFSSEWQRHLRSRLPDVMVPSRFIVLAALPLTSNGKLDRAALTDIPVPARRIAPRTPTELKIAAIWKQMLGLDEIDADANFFVLGGHSLLLTKVVAQVAEELHAQVPLRGLFDAPTLSGFAAMVDSLRGPQQPASAVSHADARREPVSP